MSVLLRNIRRLVAARVVVAFVGMVSLGGTAAAAAPGPPQGTPEPPARKAASAPGQDPLSQAIREAWDTAKGHVTESAVQMPDAEYAYKPVDQVRTFGQILAHLAGANYVFCSAARGEASPFAEDHFEKTATTKAAIVKALNESLAYCDGAYDGLTDRSAAEPVQMPFGMPEAPRAAALLGNTGHNQEHYGNLVTYFRMKGMVPPSSRR